ncbi:MAG: hypothetical protein KVP17_000067 [Porospora cf. gigantea B]|uniref:uncharacterized protein n=1 Tax=Porospora cf. gigantea B TaxID=2853592 RepID=UPI003571CF5D|nr:MAG: hypothetical protein KVP17_000067 [Porospora cf. gigantea B]
MAFFFRSRPPPEDPLRAISGSWSVENVTSLDAQTKLIQTVIHSTKRLKELESQAPLEESVELFLRASGTLLAHMSGFLDAWAEEEDRACVVGLAPQMAWAALEWRNFVVFCIREYHQGDSQRQIVLLDDMLSSILETLSRNPCRECIESLTRMRVGEASVLGRAARHVNAEVRSMCWGVLVALIEFEGTPRSNLPFPGLCRGPLAGDVDSLVSAETALMEGLVREAIGQGAVIPLGDDDLSQERARNLQSACRQRSTKLLALLLEDPSSPLFNLALMKSVVDSFLSESSCDPTEWTVIHSLTSSGQDYLVETEAFQLLMTVNLTAVSEAVDSYREGFMDLFGSYVATTLPIFSSPPRSGGAPTRSLRLEMASAALVQFWRSRSLTRVVDGAIASGFLQELVEHVGNACLLQYPDEDTLHSWIPQAVSSRFLFMLESSLFDSRVQQLMLKSSTWSRTFLSSNRNFVVHGRRLQTKLLESHHDWVKTCLTATSEEGVSVITDLLRTATLKKSYIHWSGGRTAHLTFAGALWPAWAARSLTGASLQGNATIVELLMCLRAYQSSSTTVFSQLLAGLTTLGFRLTDLVDHKPSDQGHLTSFKDLHNVALKGLSGLVGWQAADQVMLDCFLDSLKALGQLVTAAPTADSLCTYLLALPLERPTWVAAREVSQTTLLGLLLSYARLMHSLLSKKDGSSPQVLGAPEEVQSSLSWCLARVLIFLCMWEDRINGESAENGAADGFVDVVSSDPQQLLFFVELLKDLMRLEMVPWNGSDSNCPMLDSLVSVGILMHRNAGPSRDAVGRLQLPSQAVRSERCWRPRSTRDSYR